METPQADPVDLAIAESRRRRERFYADPRFWLAQLAILLLWIARLSADLLLGHGLAPPSAEFTTVALFIVPVLYTTFEFEMAGGLASTAWAAALTLPRALDYVHRGSALGAWADLMQVLVLTMLAMIIGTRVGSEHEARSRADAARAAHLAAEARYRELFASNAAPILLVDSQSVVVEANRAAEDMLSPLAGCSLVGMELRRVLGKGIADGQLLTLCSSDGEPDRTFRARASVLKAPGDPAVVQVVLQDVTEETIKRRSVESFATRVLQAQEEERLRIAQELHDGPLQDLIYLCRQIDDEGGSEAIRETAQEVVTEIRQIARGLRPSVLDDLGLPASIRYLLSELEGRSSVETSFGSTGSLARREPAVELAIFRVAQEAISNIERHAAATKVAVGLSVEPTGIRLLVTDNGRGIDHTRHRAPRPGSLGITGMHERVALLGGRLAIHSEPGGGTTVEAWVPFRQGGLPNAAS